MGRCRVAIDQLACLWALLTQNTCAGATPWIPTQDTVSGAVGQGAAMKHVEKDKLSRKLMNTASGSGTSSESPSNATPGAGNPGNEIVQVTTALEFVEAIAAQTAHIVVVEHLDLDEVPDGNPLLKKYLLEGIPASVLSITGQCADPPTPDSRSNSNPAPVLTVASMTCVIRTSMDLIKVLNGRMWLSQLYLRLNRQGSSSPMIHVRGPGELWMSQMTVQGDGAMQGWTALTTLDSAKLLVDESTFSHIGGRSDGISLGLGTSSFTRTNFDSSPIINADKALLRLYDDHVMKLDVVEIPTGSESAGSPISTYDDPVLSVFADAMTSTGLEILDRSTGSVGRAGVSSRADGDFITKHDQWVVDVRKERDTLLAALPQAQAPENLATTETLPGTAPETAANVEGSDGDGINLTVVVCITVAGMCVLVAAVLSFLLLCSRGRGEPEGDPMKAGHSVMCDSNLMDADSKATSITDAMSSHHNNRMFRMHNSTPFNGSSTGPRIPSSSLTNSNNHNVALSAGGSQGSGQPLPPGAGGKGAPNNSGGGWYWPTLAQELDALSDTRDTTSQQDINNAALTGNSLYTRTKGSTNHSSRPSRSGAVMGSTVPSPRTLGSNGIHVGGPNMLMHASTGAGPPGGIPIAGTGDGFSNVFSGGVVSMAQSHHLGNTMAMSTAQLGAVGRPVAPGPGPSDDSAAHYIRIEVDQSDDENAASQEQKKGAHDSSAAHSAKASSDTKLTNDVEAGSVAVSSTGDADASKTNGRTGPAAQRTDVDLRNAPATPEPAQSTPPAATSQSREQARDFNAESGHFRSDAVPATHSPRPSPRSFQEGSRTAGLQHSGSTAHTRRRSFHKQHSGQTQLTQLTCSSELDGSQAGMSSTALMDTSRLVGPVVGKLLSSPAAPRPQDLESSDDRFGGFPGTRSNTSTSNNLNPPTCFPDPDAIANSNSESRQSVIGSTAGSARGKRSRKALRTAAQANSDSATGGFTGANGSRRAFHIRAAERNMLHEPDSPHSKTVSLSGGLSSRMEGDSLLPTRSINGSETKSRHPQPAGHCSRGKAVRKQSTRNDSSIRQKTSLDHHAQTQAERSVSVESPMSTSCALNGVSANHEHPAVSAKSYSLLHHSDILSEQSHSGSHTGSNMFRSGAESALMGRGSKQLDIQRSPRTAAFSQGSTAPMSSVLAPGAATRELHKLDALAEHSEIDMSAMDDSDMAGIGMPVKHRLQNATIHEEHNTALSSHPDGAQPSRQLALMYGSASAMPSQLPDGNSRSKLVAFSGYMPDGDSENVLSTFGNTGTNMHALHEYHNLQAPVPEDGSMGDTSSMSGLSAGVLRPAVHLAAVSGSRRGAVTSVPPCKPQPVAVMQSLSSCGEQSQMGLIGQHSADPLADVPGACDSTGLLSSELDIAPPRATSRPRAAM